MEKVLHDVRDLAVQDVVRVTYPAPLKALVEETERKANAFYALPMELKRALEYQPDTLLSGVGYQGPEDGSKDPKEHVHSRLNETVWLRGRCVALGEPVITDFIESTLTLLEALKPFSEDIVLAAEDAFEIPGFARRTMALADQWTLRCLNYFSGTPSGEDIAAQHLDKGGFTLHLRESDEGFERLRRDGVWEPIRFGGGETLVIAGARLQYLSECRLTAVCHRVRSNERTARVGRTSIVCFYDFEDAPYYNKKKYGAMQGFPEGFNYGMPFSQYRELFTSTPQ